MVMVVGLDVSTNNLEQYCGFVDVRGSGKILDLDSLRLLRSCSLLQKIRHVESMEDATWTMETIF